MIGKCNIIIKRAFLNVLGLLTFVVFSATIMTDGEKIFGKMYDQGLKS